MSGPGDSTDWESGQPAPWLDQYGPPPIDASIAGAPGADSFGPPQTPPPPDQPLPPVIEQPQGPTPVALDLGAVAPQGAVPGVALDGQPISPTGAPGSLPFAPPWLPPDVNAQSQNRQDVSNAALAGAAAFAHGSGPAAYAAGASVGTLPALADDASGKVVDASRIAVDPKADIADRQQAWLSLPPEQRAVIIATGNPEELAPLANIMDPGDVTAATLRHNDLSQQHYNDQRIALELQRQQQAQQDFQVYQAAQTKAAADTAADRAEAKRISMIPIDPNKGHGVGRFIADVITAGIGGAMSQYTGGKNLALEAHQRRTEQSIQIQKDNIANQLAGVTKDQNFVAEQLQRSGDMYRSTQIYRIAQNDRADGELAATAQNYDQQGTTAYKIANARMAIGAATQQATQALHQQNFKNNIDAANAGLAIEKDKFDESYKTKQLANESWKTALDAKRVALEKQKADDERGDQTPMGAELFKARYPGVDVPPEIAAGGKYTPKQYQTYLATNKAQGEASKTTAEAAKAKAENTVAAPIKIATDENGNTIVKTVPATNDDGSQWVPPPKFQAMAGGAYKVNRLADQLSREIGEWGGQSDIKKGEHWQQIKGDYQDLIFALHETKGIEGFRPGTSELLHELTGDVDPTSFLRDARSGIQRVKQNVNLDLNATALSAGYHGPEFDFGDTSHLPPPKLTEVGAIQKGIVENKGGGLTPDDVANADLPDDIKGTLSDEVRPSSIDSLNQLKPLLYSSDAKKSDVARAALVDAMNNALTTDVRDAAQRMLADWATFGQVKAAK